MMAFTWDCGSDAGTRIPQLISSIILANNITFNFWIDRINYGSLGVAVVEATSGW
jgi:hypothetical protein